MGDFSPTWIDRSSLKIHLPKKQTICQKKCSGLRLFICERKTTGAKKNIWLDDLEDSLFNCCCCRSYTYMVHVHIVALNYLWSHSISCITKITSGYIDIHESSMISQWHDFSNYQPGGVFKSQDSRAILAKSLSKSAIAWSSGFVPHGSGELASYTYS